MFAPEGYISLAEVYESLACVARQWRAATPNIHDTTQEKTENWLDFNLDPGWNRELAYKDWLMNCFMNEQERSLFATHPNGSAIKLASSIVQRHKTYDGDFDDTPEGWQSIIEHLKDPFIFIENSYYTIDLHNITDWLDMEEWGGAYSILKPLDKSPLCWKIPNEKAIDWRKTCGIDNVGQQKKSRGRPEKVSIFAAAYKANFPEGTGGRSQKQVLAELQRVTGMTGSIDTLVRAISLADSSK